MKLKALLAVSVFAGVCSLNVHAAKDVSPYSDCGIGAAIFSDNDTAAALSNVIWDLGSTALTSGVSSPNTCSSDEKETASFIYKSYNEVAEQTVKGSGEHLTAMLTLAGCASTEHGAIIQSVRTDFATTIESSAYSEQSDLQKASEYYNIVRSSVQGSCSLS